jgi:hypothetical protein
MIYKNLNTFICSIINAVIADNLSANKPSLTASLSIISIISNRGKMLLLQNAAQSAFLEHNYKTNKKKKED